MCVCARVCACVRVCVRVCARARVCVYEMCGRTVVSLLHFVYTAYSTLYAFEYRTHVPVASTTVPRRCTRSPSNRPPMLNAGTPLLSCVVLIFFLQLRWLTSRQMPRRGCRRLHHSRRRHSLRHHSQRCCSSVPAAQELAVHPSTSPAQGETHLRRSTARPVEWHFPPSSKASEASRHA